MEDRLKKYNTLAIVLSSILVCLPVTAFATMLEIKYIEPAKETVTQRAAKEELEDSLGRAKDLVSHVRKEFNDAGCPSLWKSDQCQKLLTTFEELVKYAGPSGGTTVSHSSFTQNEYYSCGTRVCIAGNIIKTPLVI